MLRNINEAETLLPLSSLNVSHCTSAHDRSVRICVCGGVCVSGTLKPSEQHLTCKTRDSVHQRHFLSFLGESYHELTFGAHYVIEVLLKVEQSGDHHHHHSHASPACEDYHSLS